MGVIYKLRPEIKDFIIEKKKAEPKLSCRRIVCLLSDKFQIKVSKSSVNAIIKQIGLSMPVGRRLKKRRRRPELLPKPQEEIKLIAAPKELPVEKPIEVPVPQEVEEVEAPVEAKIEVELGPPIETLLPGTILLKAADYLLAGTHQITQAIKSRLNSQDPNLLAKTEALIYRTLFAAENESTLSSYINELQEVKGLALEIYQIISNIFQEVRCIKVSLSEGTNIYLDGQLYTVWSTPHIPYDFSTTINNIKSYIKKYLQENEPFILFTAPGYETPTKEFFDFILGLISEEKQITRLTLYGNKFEEIEVIPVPGPKKRSFIFSVWPWQFGHFRAVKIIGEFKSFFFEPLNEEFYLAPVEMELLQPNVNKKVTLTGCALKRSFSEKTRVIILSNLTPEMAKPEQILNLYLNHWPYPEEGFQDFSRKIELFTYTASSQHFLCAEHLALNQEAGSDLNSLFNLYLKALDLYVKWHFFPSGYEDKDFAWLKEQFYSLSGQIKQEKDCVLVTFKPFSGYTFLKDLQYACCRINERETALSTGKRIWLSI